MFKSGFQCIESILPAGERAPQREAHGFAPCLAVQIACAQILQCPTLGITPPTAQDDLIVFPGYGDSKLDCLTHRVLCELPNNL